VAAAGIAGLRSVRLIGLPGRRRLGAVIVSSSTSRRFGTGVSFIAGAAEFAERFQPGKRLLANPSDKLESGRQRRIMRWTRRRSYS